MRLTYESRRKRARAGRSTRRAPAASHPLLALQQTIGNRAVAALVARPAGQGTIDVAPVEIEAERTASHERALREEVAAALNLDPDNPLVNLAFMNEGGARALKEAKQKDAAEKAAQEEGAKPQPEIREDPFKGMTLEQRERKLREDAVKEELSRRGITDEMILKGYREETRVELGPDMRGRIVDQWIPEGTSGRHVHTYEFEDKGKTKRDVTTTDFAKGGEKTIVKTIVEGGEETSVTTMEPGYGKAGQRAALEKTSTRWVLNPDGSVTVETLDKYGRPIPGRSWRPDVLKLR